MPSEKESERPTVITGNWKMYKTIDETKEYLGELLPLVKESSHLVTIAVPFTSIQTAAKAVEKTAVTIGAQNMNAATEGAFTGEIAAQMIKNAGAQFVILGHSERRSLFQEDNTTINKKVKRALKEKLQLTLCIGETAQEREQGKTETVLEEQLTQCLEGVSEEQMQTVTLAYEPIWAIGAKRAATTEVAEKAHAFCRHLLSQKWSEACAKSCVLQYGGSVDPDNAASFLQQPNIDGLLIGGASLSAQTFSQIVHAH